MTPSEQQELLYGPDVDFDYEEPFPTENLDRSSAAYHSRRAEEFKARIDEINALFDDEIAKLEERRKRALVAPTNGRDWHYGSIQAWHRAARAAGNAEKTEHLPGGPSKLHQGNHKVVVQDEDQLRAWLQGRPDPLSEDGDALEAIVYKPQPDKFYLSELKRRYKRIKRKKGDEPEPGTPVPLVDENGEDVPGVVSITAGDDWSMG